jgi:hypothetical protein
MPPFLAFLLGTIAGAAGSMFAPYLRTHGQPMLKEAIKTALLLAREGQVRGVQLMEMIEDAYAEAQAELAAAAAPAAPEAPAPRRKTAAKRAPAKRAGSKRASVKRSSRRAAAAPAAGSEAANVQ